MSEHVDRQQDFYDEHPWSLIGMLEAIEIDLTEIPIELGIPKAKETQDDAP